MLERVGHFILHWKFLRNNIVWKRKTGTSVHESKNILQVLICLNSQSVWGQKNVQESHTKYIHPVETVTSLVISVGFPAYSLYESPMCSSMICPNNVTWNSNSNNFCHSFFSNKLMQFSLIVDTSCLAINCKFWISYCSPQYWIGMLKTVKCLLLKLNPDILFLKVTWKHKGASSCFWTSTKYGGSTCVLKW